MENCLGRPRYGDPPIGNDHEIVAQHRDFLHDMTREQDAAAISLEVQNHFAQGAGGHDVETIRRFVQDDGLRPMDQRARQRDTDALTV